MLATNVTVLTSVPYGAAWSCDVPGKLALQVAYASDNGKIWVFVRPPATPAVWLSDDAQRAIRAILAHDEAVPAELDRDHILPDSGVSLVEVCDMLYPAPETMR